MFARLQHYYTEIDFTDDSEECSNALEGVLTLRAAISLRSPSVQRAILPLPSRARGKSGVVPLPPVELDYTPTTNPNSNPKFRSRKKRVVRDCEEENFARTTVELNGVDHASMRKEVFQSITCTLGIRDKSFEELRLECYKQTMIATGSSPKPVVASWLSIPPAFTPFVEDPASEVHDVIALATDVVMSIEPLPLSF